MNWSSLSSVFRKQLMCDFIIFSSSQGLFAEYFTPRDDHLKLWNISRIECKNVIFICFSLICTCTQVKITFVSMSVYYFQALTLQKKKNKKIFFNINTQFFAVLSPWEYVYAHSSFYDYFCKILCKYLKPPKIRHNFLSLIVIYNKYFMFSLVLVVVIVFPKKWNEIK